MVSSTHQRTNLALNFLTRQLLLSPFAIFLESLKLLFSYMIKSIFLENKYLLFYKESFVSHPPSEVVHVVSGEQPMIFREKSLL